MIQTDIRDLIQKHGLAFPEDIVDEKIWKQSQLVTAALIRALIQDYYKHKKSQSVSLENLGWRNKHKIYLLSEDMLSQRTVYNKCGVIELLVRSDFIEKREAISNWGKQVFQYRLILDFLPKASTLLESIRLFIGGEEE